MFDDESADSSNTFRLSGNNLTVHPIPNTSADEMIIDDLPPTSTNIRGRKGKEKTSPGNIKEEVIEQDQPSRRYLQKGKWPASLGRAMAQEENDNDEDEGEREHQFSHPGDLSTVIVEDPGFLIDDHVTAGLNRKKKRSRNTNRLELDDDDDDDMMMSDDEDDEQASPRASSVQPPPPNEQQQKKQAFDILSHERILMRYAIAHEMVCFFFKIITNPAPFYLPYVMKKKKKKPRGKLEHPVELAWANLVNERSGQSTAQARLQLEKVMFGHGSLD